MTRRAIILTVSLLLLNACRARRSSSESPTPTSSPAATVSFQERPVIEIVPPTDPRFSTLHPICDVTAGCPGLSPGAAKSIVAIDPTGNRLMLGPVIITQSDVAHAIAQQIGGTQADPIIRWVVAFGLTPAGTAAFATATTRALTSPPPRNQIAIVVNGVVISSPVVQAPITAGAGEISGNFTEQQAKRLAASLAPS